MLQLVIFIGGFSGELWDGGLLLLARIPQVPFVFYNLNLTVAWFAFPFSPGYIENKETLLSRVFMICTSFAYANFLCVYIN